MARISYPAEFIESTRLFKKIKKKHDADIILGGSVLTALFTSKDIDIVVDNNNTDAAIEKHNDFEAATKTSEQLLQTRDTLFTPVFADHRKCVQFLKSLLPDPHDLGAWDVTVDGTSRIVYAVDYIGKQIEVGKFIEKHFDYAAGTSPLEPFLVENEIDLAANQTKNINSLTNFTNYETKVNEKENLREQRDNLFDPVDLNVHTIAEYLMNLFPANQKKVGEWGFTVDDSPQKDVVREGTVLTGAVKTLNNVALGSQLENTGTTAFDIYRGATAVGSAVTVSAGQKFTILRGYGTSTIKNTSSTTEATYKATFTG